MGKVVIWVIMSIASGTASAAGLKWFRGNKSKPPEITRAPAATARKENAIFPAGLGAPGPRSPRELLRRNVKLFYMPHTEYGGRSHARLTQAQEAWLDLEDPNRYARAASHAGAAWDLLTTTLGARVLKIEYVTHTLAQLREEGRIQSKDQEEEIEHELWDEFTQLEAVMAVPIDEMFLQILGPVFHAEIAGRYESTTKAGRIEQITAVIDLGAELKRKGKLKEFFVRMPKILPHEPTEHDFAMLYFERPERAMPLAEELRK